MKRCLCSVGSWFTKTYSSNHPISTSLAEHFKNNLKLEAQGESQLKFWWKIGFTQTSQKIQRFIFFEFLLVQRKKYGLCLKCGISSFWLEGSGEWYGTPLEHFQDVSTQISCWELRSFRYVFYLLGIREDQIHPNTIYFIYVNPEKIIRVPSNSPQIVSFWSLGVLGLFVSSTFHFPTLFCLLSFVCCFRNAKVATSLHLGALPAASSAARTSDKTFNISRSSHFGGMA